MKRETGVRGAAQEIITVLGLKDEAENPIIIDPEATDNEVEEIYHEALSFVVPTDRRKFTPETVQIILNTQPDKFTVMSVEETAVETDVETNTEAPLSREDQLLTDINNAERLKDLREIVKANDEFKSIRGQLQSYKSLDELRDAMLELINEMDPTMTAQKIHDANIGNKEISTGTGDATKSTGPGETETQPAPAKEKVKPAAQAAPAKEKKAPKKEKKVTRIACACQTLTSCNGKVDEIAKVVDELYVAAGGESNVKQTAHLITVILPAAVEWGIVKIGDKGVITSASV